MTRAKSAKVAASFETRNIPGWEGTVTSFGARLLCGLLLILATALVAQAEPPKGVLMLHAFGPEFGDLYARDMRARLSQQPPGRLELYESWLVSARFTYDREDAASASYLRTLFADHPLDLVI